MIEALNPKNGSVYVDATFGGGGYTRAILEHAPQSFAIGFDKDPEAEKRTEYFSKTNFYLLGQVLSILNES